MPDRTRDPPGRSWALLGAPLLGLGACAEPNTEPNTAPNAESARGEQLGLPVAAYEVRPRDLSRTLSATGTVEARVHVRLASRAAGIVETVAFDVGDRVSAGDVLLTLDTAEVGAELARAKAQEDLARLDYERTAELHEQRLVSVADYQRARATLQAAESERRLWTTRQEHHALPAPRAGVVGLRRVEPGEAVQTHQVLLELLAVSEREVTELRAGQAPSDYCDFEEWLADLGIGTISLNSSPLLGVIRRIP